MSVRATTLAAASLLTAAVLLPGSASADGPERHDSSFTFATIGDIPYGDAQIAHFPAVVDQINADPDVRLALHLGDIKSGSSLCTDDYFAMVRGQFDRFADPLVYTPGDNEWTDCHRPNNGGYDPLERLAAIRHVFFDHPGRTLGRPMKVDAQTRRGLPENVVFERADVVFADVHVVGSNNSLDPWTGNTEPTPQQLVEERRRTAGDLALIRQAFREARQEHAAGVVLAMQADMFDPTVPDPVFEEWSAFQPIARTIAAESARFGGPVLLLNGDSHAYHVDQPLAAGSFWSDFYDVRTPAPNLTRVTIDGSTGVNDWLKVTVDKDTPTVFSWEVVPFS
ncbi:hypothetical protein [Nocardioides sp.]|uniref:hypothetical protein n=1 Tax=Nocardioides sp. TaxID=35761 RepID=UPI0035297B1C